MATMEELRVCYWVTYGRVSPEFVLPERARSVVLAQCSQHPLDIAEAEDGVLTSIDYNRDRRPDVPHGGAYEPERI